MSDVPKFVRQRLAQTASGDHPEANLLAAFAEGGLTRRERDQVLAHLSACAACREAVALATPEMPAAPAATTSRAQGARWPMLRWAGLAAAVVVVAAAVVVQNTRRSEPAQETPVSQSPPAAAATEPAKQAESAVAENKAAPVLHDRAGTKKAPADKDTARAKRENTRNQKQGEVAARVASPTLRPPQENLPTHSTELARVEPSTAKFANKAAPAEQQQAPGKTAAVAGGAVAMDQAKQAPAAPPVSHIAGSNEAVEVAAQADAMAAQKSKANVQQRAMPDRPSSAAAPAPSTATSSVVMMKRAVIAPTRWRVSSEGALEHSIDAGRSWQLVRIASPQTTFRAFCSVGRDLWAGGNGGALYHSPDDGRTWTRLTAKAGDAVLDGDIVRIEFTDAQHGSVTTSAGETWTTTDGGATWSVARR